ncbi:MAG: stage III sporulation protein AF [Eubacteriaceae bacterium]
MEFFSSWIKNIVFITVTISLVNLIIPEKLGKYVKVLSGFLVMLVILKPFINISNADTYLNDLYLKHSLIMDEKVVQNNVIDENEVSVVQNKMTVSIYKEKLITNIKKELEEILGKNIDVNLEINEDLSKEEFGTLKKAYICILEEENDLKIVINKIDLTDSKEDSGLDISENTIDKINNFFLNFYNLQQENISINKKINDMEG